MVFSPNKGWIELDSKAFLIVRSVASVFLIGLYLVSARDLPSALERTSFLVGMSVWILYTLGVGVIRVAVPGLEFRRLIQITLPFDCLALGALVLSAGSLHDPFYVWVLLESMLYATVYLKSHAWIYSAFLVIAYLAGNIAAPSLDTAGITILFLTMKAVAVLVVGWFVGLMIERQAHRADEAEDRVGDAAELNVQLERSVTELRAIAEISEIIHSTLDFDSVGPIVLEALRKVVDIPAVGVFVVDKTEGETLFSASKGLRVDTSSSYGQVDYIRGDTSISNEHFSCLELLDYNQMIVIFCADGEVIETLGVNDRIVLQAIASELVMAVENSQLYKLTKRLAITDELTNLQNYRYLQQRLDGEIGRANRYSKQLSFLMIDIDNFKSINDTHGHLVGDGVLSELGRILKTTVREVDVVARYGGEEFSVLLPETDASGAFIVAEKIRETVSLTRFLNAEGERAIHVTVSIGMANLPLHAEDKESLLRQADDALYQAKATGKDRVRAPRIYFSRLDIAPEEELKS